MFGCGLFEENCISVGNCFKFQCKCLRYQRIQEEKKTITIQGEKS